MAAEGIRVCVRARPLNERERNYAESGTGWIIEPSRNMIRQAKEGKDPMYFDRVYGEASTNDEVYESVAKPVVQSGLAGINGTIFAYGQTSSGKTYSMQAMMSAGFADMFSKIEADKSRKYLVKASYLEIYNEDLTDLLDLSTRGKLKVRMNEHGFPYVAGLTERPVTSVDELQALLVKGLASRQVGATAMNEQSSRSHTIFTVTITSEPIVPVSTTKPPTVPAAPGQMVRGALRASINFVDLAGSERASQTLATGQRLKEGANINLSLMTLSKVIRKLSDPKDKQHVPFRESNLTRILQPALGGNNKTSVLCCITQSLKHLDETINTLGFALRAKRIQNNVSVSETLDDRALIWRLRQENAFLTQKLKELAGVIGIQLADIVVGKPGESSGNTSSQPSVKRIRTGESTGSSVDDAVSSSTSGSSTSLSSSSSSSSAIDYSMTEEVPRSALLQQNVLLSKRVAELTDLVASLQQRSKDNNETSSHRSSESSAAMNALLGSMQNVITALGSITHTDDDSTNPILGTKRKAPCLTSSDRMSSSSSSRSSSSSHGIEGGNGNNHAIDLDDVNVDVSMSIDDGSVSLNTSSTSTSLRPSSVEVDEIEESKFFERPLVRPSLDPSDASLADSLSSSSAMLDDADEHKESGSDNDDDDDDDDESTCGVPAKEVLSDSVLRSRLSRSEIQKLQRKALKEELAIANQKVMQLEVLVGRMEAAAHRANEGSEERETTLVERLEALSDGIELVKRFHAITMGNVVQYVDELKQKGEDNLVLFGREIEAADHRIATLEQQLEEAKSHKNGSTVAIDQANERITQLERECAEGNVRIQELLEAKSAAEAQVVLARSDADRLGAAKSEWETVRATLETQFQQMRVQDEANYQAKIDLAESTVKQLRIELDDAQRRLDLVQSELNSARDAASQASTQSASLLTQLERVKEDLEEAKQESEDLRSAMRQAQLRHESMCDDLIRARDQMKIENEQLVILGESKDKQIHFEKERVSELEDLSASLRERLNRAETDLVDVRREASKLELDLVQQLQKARMITIQEEERLRREIEAEKSRYEAAHKSFNKERREFEDIVRAKDAEIEKLNFKAEADIEAAQREVDAKWLVQLEDQRKDFDERIKEASRKHHASAKQLTELIEEREIECQQLSEQLERERKAWESMDASHKTESARAKAKCAELQEALQDLTDMKRAYEEQLATEVEKERADKRAKYDAWMLEVQKTLDETEAQALKAKEGEESVRAYAQELKKKLEETTSQLLSTRDEATAATTSRTQLTNEIDRLKKEMQLIKKDSEAIRSEKLRLVLELETLNDALQSAKNALEAERMTAKNKRKELEAVFAQELEAAITEEAKRWQDQLRIEKSAHSARERELFARIDHKETEIERLKANGVRDLRSARDLQDEVVADAIKEQNKKMQEQHVTIDMLRQEIARLQDQNATKSREIFEKEDALRRARATVDDLQRRAGASTTAEDDVKRYKEAALKYKAQMQKMSGDLTSAVDAERAAKREQAVLVSKVEEMSRTIKMRENEIETLKKKVPTHELMQQLVKAVKKKGLKVKASTRSHASADSDSDDDNDNDDGDDDIPPSKRASSYESTERETTRSRPTSLSRGKVPSSSRSLQATIEEENQDTTEEGTFKPYQPATSYSSSSSSSKPLQPISANVASSRYNVSASSSFASSSSLLAGLKPPSSRASKYIDDEDSTIAFEQAMRLDDEAIDSLRKKK